MEKKSSEICGHENAVHFRGRIIFANNWEMAINFARRSICSYKEQFSRQDEKIAGTPEGFEQYTKQELLIDFVFYYIVIYGTI